VTLQVEELSMNQQERERRIEVILARSNRIYGAEVCQSGHRGSA